MGDQITLDESAQSYLGLIQGVINRMASTSATFKGFSATLFAGVLALAISSNAQSRFLAIWAAVAVITLFLLFDWYYFYMERQYRVLYDEVRTGKHPCDFDMKPPKYSSVTRCNTFFNFSLLCFYPPLLVFLLICIPFVN